jgi:membrane-bound metal-dependent hydrolase YbcI (DUF457 family)
VFLGHLALGFAGKRVAPRASLGALFAASQFADLLWPVLVGLGLERVLIAPGTTAVTPLDFVSYPWSHSLLMMAGWGFLIGALAWLATRDLGTATVIGALVASHWALDWITHRPDMPLIPGGARYGLGLWNSVGATVAVELGLFVLGLWLYSTSTRPRDRIGRWSLAALAVFLVGVYAANLSSTPPSVAAIWQGALAGGAILVLWAWWTDRHRELVPLLG